MKNLLFVVIPELKGFRLLVTLLVMLGCVCMALSQNLNQNNADTTPMDNINQLEKSTSSVVVLNAEGITTANEDSEEVELALHQCVNSITDTSIPPNDCDNFPCGNNGNKVLICHIPPGNPSNAHEICVSKHAANAHLAHGDFCGPCRTPGKTIN